ncbi:MAG: DUF1868 domain-containing protein, partial [Pseudomonadota bacterium]
MPDVPPPPRPDPVEFFTGRLSKHPMPKGISLPGQGGKFATDGTVEVWPGNTFVCHVDPHSAAHAALRAMQEEVKMSGFAPFFNFLPPASFHMTLFQGRSPDSDAAGIRPRGATPGMSVEASTAVFLSATEGVRLKPDFRISMASFHACYSVTVTGADAAEEAGLREARRVLKDATGFAQPDFETYVFHITLAYPAEWVSEPVARGIADLSHDLTERYRPALTDFA